MNLSKKSFLWIFIFIAANAMFINSYTQEKNNSLINDKLNTVAFLAGGTWHSSTKWPDGTPFDVEIKYYWGPTKQALHFETYEPSDGKLALIYEGLLYFDPQRDVIIQLNIKPNGEVNEYEVRPVSENAYEVMGAKTKSVVQRVTENEFDWELYLPDGNGWKKFFTARHYRVF